MRISAKRVLAAGLVASATLLAGCSYGGYGYSGVSVGVSDGGYYDGYGAPYGAPYYGYGGGWYGDFYYPGTGYYIYDRGGHRSRWNDSQRAYWESHRGNGRWEGGSRAQPAPGTSRGRYYGGNRGRSGGAQGGQGVTPQPAAPVDGRGYRGNRPAPQNAAPAARPERQRGEPNHGRRNSSDEGREQPR